MIARIFCRHIQFVGTYSLFKFNTKLKGGVSNMGKLVGKKLLLLGERDGIPGPAMEECLKDCGAETLLSVTECFV